LRKKLPFRTDRLHDQACRLFRFGWL